MNSANGKKTFSDEKVLLDTALLPTTDSISCAGRLQSTKPKANSTMSRLWHVSFALTILGLLIFSMVTATSGDGASGSTDDQGFQELLESIEPTALHEILHNHLKEKFKHGVYQEDKTAMEVVHQQNAEVARNLVELAKRQAAPASNGTITTTSSASSSVTTSEESTTSPPSSTSSSSIESPSASSISTPTFTPTLSSNSTSQSSNSGSGNSPSQTTASSTSAPTPDHSSTLDHGSVTQSIIYSTTLAGGIQSIVTQITIVPADQAASQANGGKATNTNTASASLQTNSANASARSFSLGICIGTLNLLFAWFS